MFQYPKNNATIGVQINFKLGKKRMKKTAKKTEKKMRAVKRNMGFAVRVKIYYINIRIFVRDVNCTNYAWSFV